MAQGRRGTGDSKGTVIYATSHALVVEPPAPDSFSPVPFSSSNFPSSNAAAPVPLSIFSSRLSGLQAIVRYLHDARKLPFSEIASLLGRDPRTVWSSYAQSRGVAFRYEEDGFVVPLAPFARRDLSVLETLVAYLSGLGFPNAEIARMLGLDPRTTWTVKRRAESKRMTEAVP